MLSYFEHGANMGKSKHGLKGIGWNDLVTRRNMSNTYPKREVFVKLLSRVDILVFTYSWLLVIITWYFLNADVENKEFFEDACDILHLALVNTMSYNQEGKYAL